jgi:hypothetical protein
MFKPRLNWCSTIINEHTLPIVISSINPQVIQQHPVIATMMTESKKQSIVCTLETQSTIQGVSTELAIQAGQNTKAAVVPSVYDQFHKLFSDTESLQFPPTRPWDHAIDFKLVIP